MRCPECRGCPLYEEHVSDVRGAFEHAGMWFDPSQSVIRYQGKTISVSPVQGQILGALLRARGRFLSLDVLRLVIHGDDPDGGVQDNTLRVQVSHIRSRVIEPHALPFVIRNRRGVGYAADLRTGV